MRDLEFMREARGRDGGTGIEEIEKKEGRADFAATILNGIDPAQIGVGAETFLDTRIG